MTEQKLVYIANVEQSIIKRIELNARFDRESRSAGFRRSRVSNHVGSRFRRCGVALLAILNAVRIKRMKF